MNIRLIKSALGEQQSDLVLKNAKVVDVFGHKIIEGDVAVTDGRIAGIGSYSGKQELDIAGNYLMPSFIDGHVHIESSMLCPGEFAKIIAPKGVTTIIADPHEITNVCGENGIRYMFESAAGVPVDIHFMMPSCVPATPFDHAGALIDSAMTHNIMQKYKFLGLGEMMNYPGVLNCADDVLAKIDCADIIDGHAPALHGTALNAYAASGVMTDHECITGEELLDKISCGMYIQIREGTQSKNLEALVKGITPYTMRRILFCTDDRYLGDVIEKGSISNCIAKAVALGVDPIDAITIATLNAAECYQLKQKGAIAPGYRADFLICTDITAQEIISVYKDGILIAENGKALFQANHPDISNVTHTVRINRIVPSDLELVFHSDMPVIQVMPDSLYTKKEYRKTEQGLNLCAVIERHKGTGNIGKCYINGFQMRSGAIAQTIGHDSHNITVIGEHTSDMALAVNSLGEDGGMCVVKNGVVLAVLHLPIAGILSDADADTVLAGHKLIIDAVSKLEFNHEIDPFMMLSFLSLLVIPELKLSDSGLFDVAKFEMI